jgi:hypothetical protein
MSLPAGQERTLHDIEGALQASEPQLAFMFAIFTRLNRDEPVGAEPVQLGRRRPVLRRPPAHRRDRALLSAGPPSPPINRGFPLRRGRGR